MKLAIDPGHGLGNRKSGVYDPGAVAGGHAEATLALEWALTLKQLATDAGIPCWLTRTSRDYAAPLSSRVARAKANDCTRLISIHCNAYDGTARGTETLYRDGSEQGEAFAMLIQRATRSGFSSLDDTWESRGVKPDTASQHSGGLAILRGGVLSCLVELGFIDNEDDREHLITVEARVAVCSRIVKSLEADA